MTIRTYQYQVQVLVTPATTVSVIRNVTQDSIVSDSAEAAINAEFVSVNDPLEDLQQFATFLLIPGGIDSVSQTLDLVQEVKVFGYETVVDELGLLETISTAGPIVREVLQTTLFQDVSYSFGVKNLSVESVIDFVQDASISIPLTVSQALGLTSEAFRSFVAESDLVFTETVSWGYGYDAFSNLSLSQAAADDLILNQAVTQDSVVSHAMTYFIESKCNKRSYNTFHGVGGKVPDSKPLSYRSKFLVQSLDDGTIVQLRNPETDDRRRLSYNRVNRRFTDNTLDLYSDDTWVTEERQLYTIVATKRADLDTLWTFLQDNLGREILLKDWVGQTWKVVILNPGEVYTEDQDSYWTLDFEVEGERLPGEYVIQQSGITETLSRAGSIYTRSGSDSIVFTRGDIANLDLEIDSTDPISLSDQASAVVESP